MLYFSTGWFLGGGILCADLSEHLPWRWNRVFRNVGA